MKSGTSWPLRALAGYNENLLEKREGSGNRPDFAVRISELWRDLFGDLEQVQVRGLNCRGLRLIAIPELLYTEAVTCGSPRPSGRRRLGEKIERAPMRWTRAESGG